MEGSTKHQERPNPPPPPPLRSSATTAAIPSPQRPPHSPRPMTRSEPDVPYPTIFVQVDPSTFKQVVQMLTGFSSPRPDPAPPPHRTAPAVPKRPQPAGFRLYERRNTLKKLSLNPPFPAQPKKPDAVSPSLLDFPSLSLSPVTPLVPDPFAHPPALDMEAEERAIKEKGFFLHPSPRGSPAAPEPRLLPLFPVTSPRVSGTD